MKSLILYFLTLFIISSISNAEIIRIPKDQPTIQAGINSADTGDTVLVSENTYFENINFKCKAITVASQFIMDGDTSHISKTIIDGSKPSHPDSGSVVYFISGEDSTSVLYGFTITHGSGTIYSFYDQWYGIVTTYKAAGGILIDSSGAAIRYNYIQNNTITNYETCVGGGIVGYFVPADRVIIIENNNIINNTVHGFDISGGGGISHYNIKGFCLIKQNIISHNTVRVDSDYKAVAGGIDCEFDFPATGRVIITENTVSYNELHCEYSYGAGMYFVHWETPEPVDDHYSTPLVYNNLISNNYSQNAGAGVTIWLAHRGRPEYLDMSPQPVFINNTIVNNKASRGSGIYCWNASFIFMNNILWNDLSAPGCTEINTGDGGDGWSDRPNEYNKIYIYNSIVSDGNWDDFDNKVFSIDPLFADSLYHLSENSPGVGIGRKSVTVDGATYQAPAYDIDGNIRPNSVDTLIDIGAFESPYPENPFVYPRSIENIEEKTYLIPGSDQLKVRSEIYNPENHNVNIYARIVSVNNALRDSVELFDDGNHNDGEAFDQIVGGELGPVDEENEFKLSLGIKDNDKGIYTIFGDNKKITTIGPIVIADSSMKSPFPGTYKVMISLENLGELAAATNISIELGTSDTLNVNSINTTKSDEVVTIEVGQTVEAKQIFTIFTKNPHTRIPLTVKIFSNGYHFWTDSTDIATDIETTDQDIPKFHSLSQNFPNPFNPTTLINYQLPTSNEVELSIYNLLGQKVVTLVSEKQKAGYHQVEWDASGIASGIYLYRLVVGNEFANTKKLLLLK